jgi:hypothetical protein
VESTPSVLATAALATIFLSSPPTGPTGPHTDRAELNRSSIRPIIRYMDQQPTDELLIEENHGLLDVSWSLSDRPDPSERFKTISTGDPISNDASSRVLAPPMWVKYANVAPDVAPLDVQLPAAAQTVTWIQECADLSEGQLGSLLGVNRISIRNWKNGLNIRPSNLEALNQVRDILQRAQRTHPTQDELKSWLLAPNPIDSKTPFALISDHEFDRVRMLASLAKSNVAPSPEWAKSAAASPWAHLREEPERPGEFDE